MLIIFSCAFWSSIWSSICLLWRNVYLCLIYCVVCFFDFELREQFVYFEYEALISFIACKYFLPFWVLAFCVCVYVCVCLCVFMVSFAVQKLLSKFHYGSICLFLFLFSLLWELHPKRYCCNLCQRAFCLCFPQRVLPLGLQSILSLFFYMTLENVLISFF